MGLFGFEKRRKLKKEKERLEFASIRNKRAKLEASTRMLRMQEENDFQNSGYSHGGASTSESWARRYHSESLSPKSDIEQNRKLLRERTRDLAMNAPLATAAVNSTRSNVVGYGLSPKPKIDYEFLGISKEQAIALQQEIKRQFALWAESTLCDNSDQNNFYELQQIAFSDWLKNGEEFILIGYEPELPYMPYQLRLKLVAADRVSTPGSINGEYDGIDKQLENGNSIMNGLELNPDGKVTAYYICSNFPGEYSSKLSKWARVEKRGRLTGNPNILHIFNAETAEQYRGVPFLAPVIHAIKQVTRYTEAEIMAAVVHSMLSLFVTTENGNEIENFGGVDDEEWLDAPGTHPDEEDGIKLGSGTINFLKAGEKIQSVESNHPSGNFDTFISAMATQIGAALEIAPEILLKKFGQSFSASKGALNETWRAFMMRRRWFVNDFCQQVYNLWLAEAVSKGRINAPGFFTNPLIRKAYTNATWTGPSQGWLNPVQEANAAVIRISNGLSTHEDECASLNGSDFDDNIRTLENENEKLATVNRFSSEAMQNMEEEDGEEDQL